MSKKDKEIKRLRKRVRKLENRLRKVREAGQRWACETCGGLVAKATVLQLRGGPIGECKSCGTVSVGRREMGI